MPRRFGPTLIRTSGAVTAPAAGGATDEMDFNFGTLEGAQLLGVEYGASAHLPAATGYLEYGLNFNPTATAPAAANDLQSDEGVFAVGQVDFALATSGMFGIFEDRVDLSRYNIFIVRNIALQVFTITVTSGVVARVYFQRAVFSEAELGGLVAFRR